MQARRLARTSGSGRGSFPGSRSAAGWALLALSAVAGGSAAAAPKVCGNDPALGSFVPASCPTLKDDGMGPDERAGDGIYTVEVNLTAKALLEYKLLPSGDFDGTQLGQTGTCDGQGTSTNIYNNLQVAEPDTSRPVRFYYDTQAPSDPSYAAPPGNRSAGDELMLRSPASRCPQWLAVGEFQNVPFDRTVGAVQLYLQRPGVLIGRLTAMKALASGWHWKVAEQRAAGQPARLYGPSGWAVAPCDTDSVTVPSAVRAGDIVYFTWYSSLGRLQTVVLAPGSDVSDGGVPGGLPLCPPPSAGDLGVATDLATTAPGDGGGGGGGGAPDGSAAGDGGDRPLPGIHCNCQLGGATGALPPGAGSGFVMAAAYLMVGARRRRSTSRSPRCPALPPVRGAVTADAPTPDPVPGATRKECAQ